MNNQIEMFKKFMGTGGTPQEFIGNMIRNNSNPMLNNLMQMAQKGDSKGIENFARNIFKEHGRDFDKEFSDFMSNFK